MKGTIHLRIPVEDDDLAEKLSNACTYVNEGGSFPIQKPIIDLLRDDRPIPPGGIRIGPVVGKPVAHWSIEPEDEP